MNLDSPSPAEPPRQVYHISGSDAFNVWSILVICGIVGIALLWLAFSLAGRARPDAGVVLVSFAAGAVILGLGVYFGYQTAATQLAVSADGLEFSWGTGSVSASWKEVLSVEHKKVYVGRGVYSDIDAVILSNQTKYINLTQFDAHWREGDLGRQFREYAPRLLATGPGAPHSRVTER